MNNFISYNIEQCVNLSTIRYFFRTFLFISSSYIAKYFLLHTFCGNAPFRLCISIQLCVDQWSTEDGGLLWVLESVCSVGTLTVDHPT